jgi:hypothetical protein
LIKRRKLRFRAGAGASQGGTDNEIALVNELGAFLDWVQLFAAAAGHVVEVAPIDAKRFSHAA